MMNQEKLGFFQNFQAMILKRLEPDRITRTQFMAFVHDCQPDLSGKNHADLGGISVYMGL